MRRHGFRPTLGLSREPPKGERKNTATIIEAARDIENPAAFKLWCVLCAIPLPWLDLGITALARKLDVERTVLDDHIVALVDAGYARKVRTGDKLTSPVRVEILRLPLLPGGDRFVKLGGADRAVVVTDERRRTLKLKRRPTTLLGAPVDGDGMEG